MTESHVPSGYEIGIDEQGLTQRDRDVRDRIGRGMVASAIAKDIEVSRGRVYQIIKSLEDKGAITKKDGKWVVVAQKGLPRG